MPTLLMTSGGVSATGGSAGAVRVLLVVGLLIVVVLAFGLFVLHFRKRLLGDDAADGSSPLMLEQLRGMVRRGELSEQEYDLMRRRMVEKVSARSVSEGASGARLSTRSGGCVGPMKEARPPGSAGSGARGEPGRRALPGHDLTGDRLPNPEGGE